ncbi:MAG: isoleucine--tRNA ligase [Oscillospiraceae bacterium]|nr:isoleucine--tRNA ligase [Oscillospiraceae bacterium]
MDYNATLHLPKTEFPMRAGLPKREPVQLKEWEDAGAYERIMERNEGKPLFILHDGPPYANGDIHIGTAMNKILKDIIIRYKNMTGCKAPYVPGWDTHGLPIESAMLKKHKLEDVSTAEFRDKCREFAETFVDRQREQFKRLGVMGEWDDPYLTYKPEYEAVQIEVFGEMAKKGYIYKGLRPVYWCARDKTALAEAEIEYKDVGNESIYVGFRLKDDKGKLSRYFPADKISFIIWTTTTWTLPGNLAICLNPELDYILVKSGEEAYIIAKELLGPVKEAIGWDGAEILTTLKGAELEYMTARHPFYDRESLVILGEHVTADSGTGCVHTAPGHGADDFYIGRKYNLPVVTPVDNGGVMTADAGEFAGMFYAKAQKAILENLRASGALLAQKHIEHSYAHCWRCKSPILFRATEQWFASVDAMKERAIEEIGKIKWMPAWGEERMTSMIRERSDWCISRQRKWGVPLPIFYCESCNKPLINDASIKAVADLFREKGSNAWYETAAADILPQGTACECGHTSFCKETDIMDVWFDSGSSHAAVLKARDNLRHPADLYLEGNDQYRGWFNSSLLVSVAVFGSAPYRQVISSGWTVDGEGRKMSKSLGNTVSPIDVVNKYGADILRLWVSSANYQEDMRISDAMFAQLSESYLKIRNTARFLLGNLAGYNPADPVPLSEMLPLDRWALSRLNDLTQKVNAAYDNYTFYTVYHALHNFCVTDLSNFYLDIIKDRLYCDGGLPRKSAQTALYMLLGGLTRLMAPILCFTADEIFSYTQTADDTQSVFLTDMPRYDESLKLSAEQALFWDKAIELRDAVNLELEKKRADKVIGKALEAHVTLTLDAASYELFKDADLKTILIVSQVTLKKGEAVEIVVERAGGEKCARCWCFGGDVTDGLCPRCTGMVKEK